MSTDRGILDRPGPQPARTESYGPAPHQVYEVHEPSTAPRAWVVLVHGGFWRAVWDRTHLRPLAAALASEGYAVALVEFARSGMVGGGPPGTFDDVTAALAAVRREEAGALPVVLVGHSAGGHLAVWLLHQPAAAPVPGYGPVVGAVSLAGCLDLTTVADLGLDDGAAHDLMGGTPADLPEAYSLADPARLGPTPSPVVVVHGTTDDRVPVAVAESWWSAAATPGRDRLLLPEGADHFAMIDPASTAYPLLTGELARLLART
ncbi:MULTISPECIES: alpha/beta hydrolase family protein [unclassified Ornithinimicrobium]|uniref:alpha/beta hydrolase family protein n=1 Tax=unclassified Ornithinimicrobium TaxID=2615080 RepID=UPI0038532DC3